MPLKKCTKDGKSGWQWGNSGKCYIGPGAKKKAIKQGVKIEGPEKFAQKMKSDSLISKADVCDFLDNLEKKLGVYKSFVDKVGQ